MREMINVLDVNIEHCSAKQALKAAVEYMDTPATSVIDLVTIEALMYARDDYSYREAIEQSDLVLPGQKDILEAAGITDSRSMREIESQTFLRLWLKYLHRNHCRVYLLVETDEEVDELTGCLTEEYRGIAIVGAAKVAPGTEADDMHGECDQRWRSRLRDRDTYTAGTGAIYCQEQKSDQYESLARRR